MAKELVVSVNGREKKIAIIENGRVTEFYIERGEENQGIVGNIYKGRVMRVLPGMQSAFVDIGLDRDAFLYVSDFFDEEEEFERIVIDKTLKGEQPPTQREHIEHTRLVHEQRIEAAQERAEPLIETATRAAEGIAEELADLDTEITEPMEEVERIVPPDTPFATAGPSFERIVDIDEELAENGEMLKDAIVQERIFNQIRSGEFDIEEPVSIEVGSMLSAEERFDNQFQRIDDSDLSAEEGEAAISTQDEEAPRKRSTRARKSTRKARAATDSAKTAEDEAAAEAQPRTRGRKSSAKKSGSTSTSRKRTSRKGAKAATNREQDDSNTLEDSEAKLVQGRSNAEFATRRGGRRRRRRPQGVAEEERPNGQNGNGVPVEEPDTAPEARKPSPARATRGRRTGGRPQRTRHAPTIADLLREGQEIMVQIAKEPIAKKGARITSHIALPGRFLVYMPTVEHVGVSRKIDSDSERARLRKLIQLIRAEEDVPSGGFIVRTAGVGVSEADLRDDARYLVRSWLDIRRAAEKVKAPALVHQDLDLVQRILRDQLSEDFEAIRVDSEEEYLRVVEFINRIQPRMVKRVKLYTREESILEAYGVQAELDKAIKPRVWLKSGGYLVINQTEALVAIDVNTGKFVGRGGSRLEDTITRTNLEAVEEIVRQIRLRDLGGIIVLDLIDMEDRRNRHRVMQALQLALGTDKSPTKVLSINDFGLVIMTRKRVKQSLERTLCAPCPYCQGGGLVKSPQTVCYEILEHARRLSKGIDGDGTKQTILRVNPEVARSLRTSERDVLTEIEDYLGAVDITSDIQIHQEQFDFAFV